MRRLTLLLTILALGLVVACGGGDEKSDEPSSTDSGDSGPRNPNGGFVGSEDNFCALLNTPTPYSKDPPPSLTSTTSKPRSAR
jgi:hypothetical protein